jgi:branched-chain amino acid transport system permease protein
MYVLFKTKYDQDIDFLVRPDIRLRVVLAFIAAMTAPIYIEGYLLNDMSFLYVYAIAGLGLMVLTGFTGQVSFGHAAFLAIGAYAQAILMHSGVPFLLALPCAGLFAGFAGLVIGRAVSKMHGFYLAIATLAFVILTEAVIGAATPLTGGHMGMEVPPIVVFGYEFSEFWQSYYLTLGSLLFFILLTANLLRTPTGRAMIAVRDSETSARSLGINISYYKVLSFFFSSYMTGFAGALMAHLMFFLSPESFGVMESLKLLLMIIVGGLGSINGAILGAIFISLLPNLIEFLQTFVPGSMSDKAGLEQLVFGLIIAIVIIFEPKGLHGRWMKIRLFIETFPYYKKATFIRQKQYLKTERFR